MIYGNGQCDYNPEKRKMEREDKIKELEEKVRELEEKVRELEGTVHDSSIRHNEIISLHLDSMHRVFRSAMFGL